MKKPTFSISLFSNHLLEVLQRPPALPSSARWTVAVSTGEWQDLVWGGGRPRKTCYSECCDSLDMRPLNSKLQREPPGLSDSPTQLPLCYNRALYDFVDMWYLILWTRLSRRSNNLGALKFLIFLLLVKRTNSCFEHYKFVSSHRLSMILHTICISPHTISTKRPVTRNNPFSS